MGRDPSLIRAAAPVLLTCALAHAPARAAQAGRQGPASPSASQSPTSGAASTPSGDFIAFARLRFRDRVETDGAIERTHDMKVLLRDAAAVAAFGQMSVPYLDGYGDVSFEAAIDKADGRHVEVKDARIEDLNPFGVTGTSIGADIRIKKVTIPGLEPGDGLSLLTVVRSRPLVPGRVFGEFKFVNMPTDPEQVYELDLPRTAPVAVELSETLGVAWEEVAGPAGRRVRRLTVRPRSSNFAPDGPTEDEVEAIAQPDVMFTSFRSWSEVAQWWWGLAKDRVAPDAAVRAEAARLVAGKSSPREQVETLAAFVATRVRYLNVSFGLGRMQPRPAGQVLANKYGDCKDKVALLAALAGALDIDVRPVMVHSARKNLRDDVPGPQQFDHMIAVARLGREPTDWLWLDVTNDLGLPGYLLPVLRDKPALLVEATGEGRIVHTPEKAPFTQRVEVEVKGALSADGPLRAHVRWSFRADRELEMRSAFRVIPKERQAELIEKSLARSWKEGKVSTVSTSDPSDVSRPFVVEFDVERTPPGRSLQKEWSLWLPLPDTELAAPRKKAGPTDKAAEFGLDEFVTRAEIQLPDGFAARAPMSISLDRPFATLRSEYAVEGSTLKAARRLVLLKRSITGGESTSYDAFRQAVDKDRDQDFWIDSSHGAAPAAASADVLHKDGVDAYAKKDYARAVELLEKAVAADPKLKDGYEDLGRALRDAGRKDDALNAFTRQIELEPYHEVAYAERAYVLLGMKRTAEAEKDLLKQIEVAPFKAWSYEKLGEMRFDQGRLDDAARYYASATSIDANNAEDWDQLGWAHAWAGHPKEAARAFDRVRALEAADWLKVSSAQGLSFIGETRAAAEMAESVLSKLTGRLNALTNAAFDTGDSADTLSVFDAWAVIGASALASGDEVRAERYLTAAWQGGFLASAAWNLGRLRQRQKRAAEAAELWRVAVEVPSWWDKPPDFDQRLAALTGTQNAVAPAALMKLRTLVLSPPARDDFNEELLVLIGADGRIEGVKNLTRKHPAAFERVAPHIRGSRVAVSAPDQTPVKLVRRGVLTCNRLTNCAVVFDVPGARHMARASH